ncbi:hypothetical protein RB195_022826 [Necator americanus]|uniref:Uncharacterized protein n=1 Tax=Necator americanus TaxID=51031 RepID=A0ABR1EGQ5_NECAM
MTSQTVLSNSSQPSIGQTADKGASRGNEENMTEVHDPSHYHSAIEAAEVDDEEIDDGRYLELLFAETATEESADAIPTAGSSGQAKAEEAMPTKEDVKVEETSMKTKKKRHFSNTEDQTIKVMQKDLDDLRFGFTYLSRRKIGESSTGLPLRHQVHFL